MILFTVCLFSGWAGVRVRQSNGTLLKNTSCGTLVKVSAANPLQYTAPANCSLLAF
jgi:hypothetical protein